MDALEERKTYAMLSISVAQAPTALVTFTSSAWLNDTNKKYIHELIQEYVLKMR